MSEKRDLVQETLELIEKPSFQKLKADGQKEALKNLRTSYKQEPAPVAAKINSATDQFSDEKKFVEMIVDLVRKDRPDHVAANRKFWMSETIINATVPEIYLPHLL